MDDQRQSSGPQGAITLVLPGEPVAVRLMNTIWASRSGVHDVLASTSSARAWLDAVVPGATAGPDDVDPVVPGTAAIPYALSAGDAERLRELRDALRRLAALLTGDERPAASSAIGDVDRAIAVVNRAAAQGPVWPALELAEGVPRARLEGRATGVSRALAVIARDAIALLGTGDVPALGACHAPRCVLYFVKDHPRREWCSAGCGNRARVARHYQRGRSSRG